MSLIVEPIVWELSPGGVCSSTVPGSFSPSGRSVTSTSKPMSFSVEVALSTSVPRTSGTVKLPVASQIWTVSPRWAVVPAAGFVRVTIPRSVFSSSSLSTYSGSKPASSSAASASSRGMSVTSGTSAASGPVETVTSTVEPTGTSSPSPGSAEMTVPASTPMDSAWTKSPSRPAPSRSALAAPSAPPTASRTAAGAVDRSRLDLQGPRLHDIAVPAALVRERARVLLGLADDLRHGDRGRFPVPGLEQEEGGGDQAEHREDHQDDQPPGAAVVLVLGDLDLLLSRRVQGEVTERSEEHTSE